MAEQGLRLLTLDGGGVRGLSSLMILQSLMDSLAKNGAPPPKPCEWFDMIGGTSTGGLIAIMLGRLKMNVKECIETYLAVMDSVFIRRHIKVNGALKLQGRYDTPALETAIQTLVRRKLGSVDALLYNPEPHACKVFVCTRRKNNKLPMTFTSYESDPGARDLLRCTRIWEAARATSAAPTYFEPIAIGPFGEQFLDGGLGCNNPINVMWNEVRRVFTPSDPRSDIACLLSIGTGRGRLTGMHDSCFKIAESFAEMLTYSHGIAMEFEKDHGRELNNGGPPKYYRFDVDAGLDSVELEEKKKKAEIAANTRGYLEGSAALLVETFQKTMVGHASRSFSLLTQTTAPPDPLPQEPDEPPLLFSLLTATPTHVAKSLPDYWRKLTEPSLTLYEQILTDAAGAFQRISISQLRPHLPPGPLQTTLPLYWALLAPTTQSLPGSLALALLYMLHLRHTLDYEAPAPSKHRMRILRRMDRWVDCACGCDHRWNFANDRGITRCFSAAGGKCAAVRYRDSKGGWADRWGNRRGRKCDAQNREVWLRGAGMGKGDGA